MNQVKWQELSDFFKEKRRRGISFHTIQAWMAWGMPHHRTGPRGLWFDPEACWEWYLDYFKVEKAG